MLFMRRKNNNTRFFVGNIFFKVSLTDRTIASFSHNRNLFVVKMPFQGLRTCSFEAKMFLLILVCLMPYLAKYKFCNIVNIQTGKNSVIKSIFTSMELLKRIL